MDVQPESIHVAAQQVQDAGQDWGESLAELTADMNGVGDPYGGDELGAALKDMYDTIGPSALQYFAETGFCLIETGAAMDQMAKAYTTVEADNQARVREVEDIVDSLGEV